MTARWVDTDVERARWRFVASYRPISRLQIGIEYNAAAEELTPVGNLFALYEAGWKPAVILGTSSDRIGSPPHEQSHYATVAKSVMVVGSVSIAPYMSVNYSEWDDMMNYPFGCNIPIGERMALMPMYDGNRSHLLLNLYPSQTAGASLMWIWYETFGISLFVGF